MISASDELLGRAVRTLWKRNFSEEEVATLLHISRVKQKELWDRGG